MLPRVLVAVLAMAAVCSRAVERLPIEDFARVDAFRELQLSPDGKTVGFLRDVEGYTQLYFAGTAGEKKPWSYAFGRGDVVKAEREVCDYQWVGPSRVLVWLEIWNKLEGTGAINCYGKKRWQPVSGLVGWETSQDEISELKAYRVIHSFDDDANVLMLDDRTWLSSEDKVHPHVVKIDTLTGRYRRVVENPGDVVRWQADWDGMVRLGWRRENGKWVLIYRENEQQLWMDSALNDPADPAEPTVLGLSGDGKGVYLADWRSDGTGTICLGNLTTGERLHPVLEVPGYSMVCDSAGEYCGGIWSYATRTIVGYKYVAEVPETAWFDTAFAERMASVNALLPGLVNSVVGMSNDDRCMLISSASDRQPPIYHLFYPEENRLKRFVSARPWVKPEQMAPMIPIKYKARDGVLIHGYVTVPAGVDTKNLPLVVMPHGGPWIRDVWEYDPLVQMLANRGYAVLQMNYRGSMGYGNSFSELGKREIGGKIQDDIEDAARWAIRGKLADPSRIAIVGASYGGYSALFALGRSSGLYRCGISIAGVADWVDIYKELADPEEKFAREYWLKKIGDPDTDRERLSAISPVNFASEIRVPVLLIHGKEDRIVPLRQAKMMAGALEAAGNKPETLYLPRELHGFKRHESRVAMFKAIEAFLDRHMGATPAVP